MNGAVWRSGSATIERQRTFLSHMLAVRESSTMLSAGGFAVVTRSELPRHCRATVLSADFLLTVLSAVFTYLLIVLQFESSAVVNEVLKNSTDGS